MLLLTPIRRRQVIQKYCTRQLHNHHLISKQIIKPSFPTSTHLKRYNLSLMDQNSPSIYIPFIFHYPNTTDMQNSIVEKSHFLKKSLSDTLTQYYPFAGRVDGTGSYVACNDKGIEFQEVSIECRLSELIEKPGHEVRDFLYPNYDFTCKHDSALLDVRLNRFQCGGVSILVCMSHKLGDAASLVTFMKSWAVNTRRIFKNSSSNEEPIVEPPHFLSHPDGISGGSTITTIKTSLITRKFVFPNSDIAKLRGGINGSYTSATTRVEALMSFLLKAIITVSSSGEFSPIVLILFVNMRSRIVPPLPETTIGNFLKTIRAVIGNSTDNNLNVIVEKIKGAKTDLSGLTKWEDLVNSWALQESETSNYRYLICSSLCKMQLYEIDFGWGNPYNVTLADCMIYNGFILMDTPSGDGIEATVALDEHHMTALQNDQNILDYTSSK